ncbi:hypothetical protein D3C75_270740 [compost metagenome]
MCACILIFSTLFGITTTERVHAAARAATIVSHSIPSTMKAGTRYTVSVTVRNDGTSAWTGESGYGLGAVGDADPFSSTRQAISGQSIEPGGTVTFTFIMTAPSKIGTYVTDWQMLQENVEWFGATLTVNVAVVSSVGNHAATFISDNIPSVMAKGHIYPVTVTVRNDGQDTWSEADLYRLGGAGDSDPFANTRQVIASNMTVSLGQSYSFTFLMEAPDTVGTYTTDWCMVHDGVTWFGSTLTKTVQVTDGIRDASIVSHTIPTVMETGKTYNVSIKVKNTGNTSWYEDSTSVGKYRLGGVGDSDPFTATRVLLPSGVIVKPGEEYTFKFEMKAPSTAGIYITDWRMLQEWVTWFGEVLNQTVTVIDSSKTAIYHYDAAGRLDYIKLPSGETIYFYYDANGNLIRKEKR